MWVLGLESVSSAREKVHLTTGRSLQALKYILLHFDICQIFPAFYTTYVGIKIKQLDEN